MSDEVFEAEVLQAEVDRRGGLGNCRTDIAAESVGLSTESWERKWYRKVRAGRTLSAQEVDHYCIHLLGIHPGFLYPGWWSYSGEEITQRG